MAQDNVKNEMRRLFKIFNYEYIKEEVKNKDIYMVTASTLDSAQGFQESFEISITQAFSGLTSDEKRELKALNTRESWKVAIRTAMGNIKKEGNTIDDEFVGKIIKVPALAGAVRGLFVTELSTPEKMTFVTFNKKLDIGEKQISANIRRLVWEAWKTKLPTKYEGRYTETQDKYPSGLGERTHFAHDRDSTIGTDFLRLLKEYINPSEGGESGFRPKSQTFGNVTFNIESAFYSIAEELESKAEVNVEKIAVQRADGTLEEKRIIKGKIGVFNKKGSEQTDLSRFKKNFRLRLNEMLKEAVRRGKLSFVDKKKAPKFKTSDSFEELQVKAAILKLKLPLTKKGTVDKRFKVVQDFIKVKKPKLPKEKYNAYKGKGKTGTATKSKVRLKATAAAVAVRQTKSKTKEVNLAKIVALVNKSLASTIKENMGRPALINRTGRFADSARVISAKAAKSTVAMNYTYQLNPYETFENTGSREWPAGYNPKPLIAKSIRQEAARYLETKLTLRRV